MIAARLDIGLKTVLTQQRSSRSALFRPSFSLAATANLKIPTSCDVDLKERVLNSNLGMTSNDASLALISFTFLLPLFSCAKNPEAR